MLRGNSKCEQFPFSRSVSSDLYTTFAALAFQYDLIWGEGPSHLLGPHVPEDLQELIKLLDDNEEKFLDILREVYDDSHPEGVANEYFQLALR